MVIYTAVVVRNFDGPIGDHVESFLYEYLSYYVSKNLTFTPLPHLNLENDQVFFPFGTNQALQSFCVERDLTFWAFSSLFGRGPWLQLYYVAGLSIASFGTFALLRKDHGDVKAACVAVFANVFNFYGAQKYPYHFNMACVHWATLAIVADFVIVERLVLRRPIGPTLLLVRVLVLVLGFGLELGHVLGYGLTSLLATTLFGTAIIATRAMRRRAGKERTESDLTRFVRETTREYRAHAHRLAGLFALILVFAVLYGSLVAQIVIATRRYDFGNVNLGVWWSHPIRLLIPYSPWIHPSQQPRFLQIWGDQAEEGIGSGGAGWFLLAIAILGLVQAKNRVRFLPLGAICFAFIVSRPDFDLVRWMPWFAFMRVFSRTTVMYSTFFALFALGISLPAISLRRPISIIAITVLGSMGALELATFVRIKMTHPAFAFDDTFMRHMAAIEKLPGAAVLDFPFCILGGNGDLDYLCPYMERLKSVYALQRFHHKKVIGQYLGRVHPEQTKPFRDQGWPMMWEPDDPDPIHADKQIRCLTDSEWEFFSTFFYANDFAGIQLAVDRLPKGCAEHFYTRFGKPMGEVSIPKAGRLAFVPRSPSTFDKLDPELGKRVRLAKPSLSLDVDLVPRERSAQIEFAGLSGVEWLGDRMNPSSRWRWALLPATTMRFDVLKPTRIELSATIRSRLPGQRVTIDLDGKELDVWIDLSTDEAIQRSTELVVSSGAHVLTLRYAKGNVPPDAFAPTDPRELTVMYESLVLRPSVIVN